MTAVRIAGIREDAAGVFAFCDSFGDQPTRRLTNAAKFSDYSAVFAVRNNRPFHFVGSCFQLARLFGKVCRIRKASNLQCA